MLSDTPPERDIEWTSAGAEGAWRFLQRIWRQVNDAAERHAAAGSHGESGAVLRRLTHQTIAAVTDDLSHLRFNRAIARIFELSNGLGSALQVAGADAALSAAIVEAAHTLTLLMAPMMPHLAEECWRRLGNTTTVVDTPWPKADARLIADDSVTLAIQVNGKRRDELRVPKGSTREQLEPAILSREAVIRALEGKPVKKLIVVPDRIINIVV
jgi:leucyl-tRNA synthetase